MRLEGVNWIHLAGSWDHSNELLGTIKGGKFLQGLSDSELLKDCA